MRGADICFRAFAFNQQKLQIRDEKLILYDAGCQILLTLSILTSDLFLGFAIFLKIWGEVELMKNDDNPIHSPM